MTDMTDKDVATYWPPTVQPPSEIPFKSWSVESWLSRERHLTQPLPDWYNWFVTTQEAVMMMMMGWAVVSLVLTAVITTTASPVQEETHLKDNTHWKELAEFTVRDSDISVSKYKSGATGEVLLLTSLSLTALPVPCQV